MRVSLTPKLFFVLLTLFCKPMQADFISNTAGSKDDAEYRRFATSFLMPQETPSSGYLASADSEQFNLRYEFQISLAAISSISASSSSDSKLISYVATGLANVLSSFADDGTASAAAATGTNNLVKFTATSLLPFSLKTF